MGSKFEIAGTAGTANSSMVCTLDLNHANLFSGELASFVRYKRTHLAVHSEGGLQSWLSSFVLELAES